MKKNTSIKISDFVFSEDYLLLLEVNGTSSNYAIIDTEDNSLKEIGSTETPISDTSHILFQYNFSKIKVNGITKSFSFIPKELYADNANFAAFAGINSANERVFHSELSQDIKNIYGLDNEFVSFFEENFENAVLYPQMLSLYKGCKSSDGFFANIKDKDIEILIIHEGELLFYNIFEYANDEELQYYLLLIAQQNGIDPNLAQLKVSGEVPIYSLTFERIKTLFPKVDFNVPVGVDFAKDFANINLHRYFSLLNMYLCE